MTIPSTLLDDDGYPTEDALNWFAKFEANTPALRSLYFDTMKSIWWYGDMLWNTYEIGDVLPATGDNVIAEKRIHYVSTGGWSGNEDLISAMNKNQLVWFLCWYQSRRGGHYIFEE